MWEFDKNDEDTFLNIFFPLFEKGGGTVLVGDQKDSSKGFIMKGIKDH